MGKKRKYDDFRYTTDAAAIPTAKVVRVTTDELGRVFYACPDYLWREHYDEWVRLLRQFASGDRERNKLPNPMPFGHLMFTRPTSYGCVPFGSTDEGLRREAIEKCVRATLSGWDRELTKTPAGRDRFEAIVKATVDAEMNGTTLGAAPYLACICAST